MPVLTISTSGTDPALLITLVMGGRPQWSCRNAGEAAFCGPALAIIGAVSKRHDSPPTAPPRAGFYGAKQRSTRERV